MWAEYIFYGGKYSPLISHSWDFEEKSHAINKDSKSVHILEKEAEKYQ